MNFLTPRAQQVLALSRREADRLGHDYVGTEHLLLGLVRLGQGGALNVLNKAKAKIDLETICLEMEKHAAVGPSAKLTGNIPYTPRVKKVLALAGKEAGALDRNYVGTEHFLLGLLREGDGAVARVLRTAGLEIEQARALAAEERSEPAADLSPQVSAVCEVQRTSQLDDMSKKLDAIMDLLGRLALEVTELRLNFPKGNA
jgi:ATP-dependent Clp protease ATP-binding subunit ClpA